MPQEHRCIQDKKDANGEIAEGCEHPEAAQRKLSGADAALQQDAHERRQCEKYFVCDRNSFLHDVAPEISDSSGISLQGDDAPCIKIHYNGFVDEIQYERGVSENAKSPA